jgi:hypothetical protein
MKQQYSRLNHANPLISLTLTVQKVIICCTVGRQREKEKGKESPPSKRFPERLEGPMDPRYGPRWREGGIRFDYGRNPRMLSIPAFVMGEYYLPIIWEFAKGLRFMCLSMLSPGYAGNGH